MKNKYASNTSLILIPEYDEFYDQGTIPQQPHIQPLYCFKKCQFMQQICCCTLKNQSNINLQSPKNVFKNYQNILQQDEQEDKKQDMSKSIIKGADQKRKGVLKTKSYKGMPEQQGKQNKKIQFDIPRQIKALKASPKSSLLNSILQCFLNSRYLQFNQKEFGFKSLAFNSYNQLKQLKDNYCSVDSEPICTERINSIFQSKKQEKDCYEFLTKMLDKLIIDNKSFQKLNNTRERNSQLFLDKTKISLLTQKSAMEEMFQIETQKVYNCTKCKLSFAKTIVDNFLDISVNKQKDIESIIEKQFNKKPIADKCNSCNAISKLTVSQFFRKTPNYLIFGLHYQFKNHLINPSQQIELTVNDIKVAYYFHSLIMSKDDGEFYCIVLNTTSNQWYKFEDENILILSKNQQWQNIIQNDRIIFVNYQLKKVKNGSIQKNK